jgi:hypothetical protein
MTDFLRRIFRMLAAVVVQRFDQRRADWHGWLSTECVIGKMDEIAGAVE